MKKHLKTCNACMQRIGMIECQKCNSNFCVNCLAVCGIENVCYDCYFTKVEVLPIDEQQ